MPRRRMLRAALAGVTAWSAYASAARAQRKMTPQEGWRTAFDLGD